MRIEAIRLSEVGPFARGCAIENLSPGLSVFAGPNEYGKSTIFRALRLLFEEAYSANNKAVRQLRPDHGGAPCIECDFEVSGRRWRLRKQYLAGKAAELRELDGRRLYRGGDVEPALEDITAAAFGTKSALPLLWVAQGESLRIPVPDPASRKTLEDLTRAEAEAVSGGAQLAQVHDQTVRQLHDLVTAKARRPKAGSAYARAISAKDALSEAYDVARAKADASAARRKRLIETRTRIAELTDPLLLADQQDEIANVRRSLESAQQALAQADLAAERRERAAAEHETAGARLAEFDRYSAELATTRQAQEAAQERRAALSQAITEAAADLADVKARAEAAKLVLEQLQREKLVVERQARRHALRQQHDALQQRLSRARDVTSQLQADAAAHREITVDEQIARALQQLATDIAALEAQITATAARIEVAYEAGRDGGFKIDGVEIAAGAGIIVDRPLTLSVPGIGEIRVLPGGAADGEDPLARLAAARNEQDEILARHRLATVAQAIAAWQSKRDLAAQLTSKQEQLAAVAPEGMESLAETLADLATQIADLDTGEEVDGVDVEERWSSATQEVAATAAALATANDLVIGLRHDDAKAKAEIESLEARRQAAIDALSCAPDALEQVRADLAAGLDAASQALNEAVREVSAWSEKAPSRQQLAELEAALAEAERRQRTAATQLAQLREEMRALEGALSRDLEDGVDSDVVTLEESLAAARRQVDQFACDVDALELLAREVAVERDKRSDLVVGPVAERLRALAHRVLPNSQFELDGRLAVTGVRRAEADEQIERISDGTREQVSVLARMAFAGLLAEAGRPVPLIFDDALVFSDDNRLARLFEVLQAAAATHQIVLLTCHGRSFEPLITEHGGKRLELSDWQPQGR